MSTEQDPHTPDIDVSSMTLEDLEKIQNPVLKEAMIEAMRRRLARLSADYTSHSQHADHNNNAA